MSFATPADLVARYDVRAIGDLLNDDGTTATAAQVLTNPNTQVALDDGAGEIVVALIGNQHYLVSDLTALALTSTPSASTLKRLNCARALPLLFGRRVYNADEIGKRIPDYEWSEKMLEMLKNGQRVFELPVANTRAGVMATTQLGGNLASQGTCLVGHNARAFGITPVNRSSRGLLE